MPHRPQCRVTQPGVTFSQPGVCVSVTSGYLPDGKVILNVRRNYEIKNEFGGIGVRKALDHDGKIFDNSDLAWEFALYRGYLRKYYRRKI